MKKDGLLLVMIIVVALLVLSLNFAIAADEEPKIEKARTCLEGLIKDKCDSLSTEEQAFSILAVGKCSSELESKSKDDQCWPSSGCMLKETSLAVLSLNKAGRDTGDAEDWLLSKAEIAKDLVWYLEIDPVDEASCRIDYGTTEKSITIGADKKISGSAGTCLSVTSDGYWLKIDEACYNNNFTVSCGKDFITTLLYKKKTGSTVYVSSKTNSATADGETEEKVSALCFKQANVCDYEGSLWATLALSSTNHDVSSFLPYLIAMTEENEKYFPYAFLYIVTGYDDYFTKIVNEQKNNYWKITDSTYGQFYDSALALLALQDLDSEQATSAKTYLLNAQDESGCWRNNVRDTAFLLYAAWPEAISISPAGTDYCEDYKYSCASPLECSSEDKIDMPCRDSIGKVCCKVVPAEQKCSEKEGIICEEGQECAGSWIPAPDTTRCCLGTSCTTPSEESECEKQGYSCSMSCADDEESKSYECEEGSICCGAAPVSETSYTWVWLLIILIILVILAIIFRNQLKIWVFKIKNKFKKGSGQKSGGPGGFTPFPPTRPMPMTRPRMILPRQFQQPPRQAGRQMAPARRPESKTDKELEETLKKLKEMSK